MKSKVQEKLLIFLTFAFLKYCAYGEQVDDIEPHHDAVYRRNPCGQRRDHSKDVGRLHYPGPADIIRRSDTGSSGGLQGGVALSAYNILEKSTLFGKSFHLQRFRSKTGFYRHFFKI